MNRPLKSSSTASRTPSGRPGASAGPRSAGDVAARRGDSTRAANAKRKERNGSNGGGGNSGGSRASGPRPPKVDMFAAFDEGDMPNPDATFAELGVPAPLIKALLEGGIDRPFPIQAATMADCMGGRGFDGRPEGVEVPLRSRRLALAALVESPRRAATSAADRGPAAEPGRPDPGRDAVDEDLTGRFICNSG